jgi:heptosyltransferase-1
MKIAIVKLSALGDVVHAMFILQFIKKHYPLSQIDWIVEDRFKGILELNPHISNIKCVNLNKAKRQKSIKVLFGELCKVRSFGNYDLVIDFQGLIKTAIISKLLKSKKVVGFDWNSAREKFASYAYNQKTNIGYDQNTILRYSKLISEALNIQIKKEEIYNKEVYLFSNSKLSTPKSSYIIFVIGSTWESRNYPTEKFVQVAESIKKKCIVIWGNEEEREKATWMSHKSNYIQVAPKLELNDLKLLIGNSSLLVGNDTGPSHMSWALNIPSIILFGPTPVERIFQTNINRAIKSKSIVNHFKLNKNDFSINEISVNEVVKIIKQLL